MPNIQTKPSARSEYKKSTKKSAPIGHKIAFYIRVSTEEQAASPEGSIKNQEERLRAVVKLKNMEGNFREIRSVFVDRAKSGKDTNRPELQKLLLAIRKQEIDLVMVSELSRISRSIKDFSDIWDLMKANACGFYSNRENFDTTTAAGEMVLFTVANIAQFERRQISERISLNFNIRAQRGLYNGGAIPFGYKRVEGKPGYLEVDEESAIVVRAAFRAFLQEGVLATAARWLNEQGYRVKKENEGGGKPRLGLFTVGYLKTLLRNRRYIGVKTYMQNGEEREAEAVWPALLDRDLFDRVNEQLDKNYRRNKDTQVDRYPYILSGLITCGACGDRMTGRSAHGRSEKIGYYEHGWSTRKGAFSKALKRECMPYRVLAKTIEPRVWAEVCKLFENETFAEELLKEARKVHSQNPGSKEVEKCNHVIFSVGQQLERMAERLLSLPMTISPTPIYHQMEKLEGHRREAEIRLAKLKDAGVLKDPPAEMRDFRIFLESVRDILKNSDESKLRAKVVQALVRKIVVNQDGFEIHFKVGETYIKIFLNETENQDLGQKKGAGTLNSSPYSKKNLEVFGSSTCINGGRERDRTDDPHNAIVVLYQLSYAPTILVKESGSTKYCHRVWAFASWRPTAIVGR